jgi:hypothetical protein
VQPTTAQDATGWQFTAAPYVWAPSTSLDSSINGIATGGDFSGDSNTDFVDVLEELEFAFLGHAEAKKDRFTLFGDLIYLRLSPEHQTAPFNVGPLSFSSAQFKLELEATIIEAGGTYEFARGEISELSTGRAASAELLAGVRYTTLDVEAKFSTSVRLGFSRARSLRIWNYRPKLSTLLSALEPQFLWGGSGTSKCEVISGALA